MDWYATFCHPLKPDIIDLGDIDPYLVEEIFNDIPWIELVESMEGKHDKEIHYAPSLEIANRNTGRGIVASILGPPAGPPEQWLVFYMRPKMRRSFWGLGGEYLNKEYLSDKYMDTREEILECYRELIACNHERLEELFDKRKKRG